MVAADIEDLYQGGVEGGGWRVTSNIRQGSAGQGKLT